LAPRRRTLFSAARRGLCACAVAGSARGGKEIQALALLHPAYLLRQPAQKKLAWQDLRMLDKEINRLGLFPKVNGERDGT
jgi:uracil-DNA glycosylase